MEKLAPRNELNVLPGVYKSPPSVTEPTQQDPSPQKNEDLEEQ